MSLPDNTEQILTNPIAYDSDIFTGEDLERASAIFRKYYPEKTLESIQLEQAVLEPKTTSIRVSARELHKYSIGLIGILFMFLVTYPIAMSRVSQSAKYAPYGSHLKSLTPEYR
jgi:hypothetical protein